MKNVITKIGTDATLWFKSRKTVDILTSLMDQTFSSATIQSDSMSRHFDSFKHRSRIRTVSVVSSSAKPALKHD
jgi:hypothetical protein